MNINEESIEQHIDSEGNVYRIRILSKGENLFFQENDKYLFCSVNAEKAIIEVDSIRKWEPNKRMSPKEKARVVGLVEKYYRKVYHSDVKLYSRRAEKRKMKLKALINRINEVDVELGESKVHQKAVQIDLDNPNGEKESGKRMNAFFYEYGFNIQDVTAEVMTFFVRSKLNERVQLWKGLSETKLLKNYLYIDREEQGSVAWFKDRILLMIVNDLGSDTRDVLLEIQVLSELAKEKNIDFHAIVGKYLYLANKKDKHGMGSMKTILERMLTH